MEGIKALWARKYESRGRLDIMVFFTNLFLMIIHIFFLVIYAIIGHTFMSVMNLLLLLFYGFFFTRCYKHISRYMNIVFITISIHILFGVLSFGWVPCYQNWCFGLLSAYFMPAFTKNPKIPHKQLYYPFLIVFFYFLLSMLNSLFHFSIMVELRETMNQIIFIANNMFVFIAISAFTLFYTSNNDRKVRTLTRKADYDELTNLYNRHALNVLWNRIVSSAKEKKKSYAIAIIDIDHFKNINDQYGHTSGDMVLKKIANIMKVYSIKGIVPGRWGGEEFIMIAPSDMRYSEFTKILETMRIKLSETKFIIEEDQRIDLTVSIGSTKTKEYQDIEKAVSKADIRLYKAKKTGRNKLVK